MVALIFIHIVILLSAESNRLYDQEINCTYDIYFISIYYVAIDRTDKRIQIINLIQNHSFITICISTRVVGEKVTGM